MADGLYIPTKVAHWHLWTTHYAPGALRLLFFLMWTIFKVFIELVTILLPFYVLFFWPRGMWNLSSVTRDRTRSPCIGRWNLNHWTTREVPLALFFRLFLFFLMWTIFRVFIEFVPTPGTLLNALNMLPHFFTRYH